MTTDPGIILFGKKIGIPEYSLPCPTSDDSPKTPSINEDDSPEKLQTLKKPDKILPCPRCESMNTKFCYYNNSNVNQPRHFCKSCQRYWTAGGTMRSMPVGAGRRKKKNTSSDCRFVISQQEVFDGSHPHIDFAADSSPTPKNILSFTPNSVVEKPQETNGVNGNNGIYPWIPYNYNPWVPMPIPFYPPPYWNSVPWLPTSAPNLGKHLLDRELSEQNEEPKKQKNSVLIPKTLRIDDPDEAAKSSIWVTLGIKNENSSRRDVFKGFKGDEKKKELISESSLLLQANPAAFSRSRCFQERV